MEYYVRTKTFDSIVKARAYAYSLVQHMNKDGIRQVKIYSNRETCGYVTPTRTKIKMVWHSDSHIRVLYKDGTLGRILL